MAGISMWQLLIVAAIIIMLFGTKKIRYLGSDLGKSIQGFKKAINEDNLEAQQETTQLKSVSLEEPVSNSARSK